MTLLAFFYTIYKQRLLTQGDDIIKEKRLKTCSTQAEMNRISPRGKVTVDTGSDSYDISGVHAAVD